MTYCLQQHSFGHGQIIENGREIWETLCCQASMNLLELLHTLMNIALLEDQQGGQFNGMETNMQWICLPSRKASNSSRSPKEATQ